jgi:UDP-4-amino-4,6-dideoxy-N-acetyl-beta-L-altrosamine N-acetyltransferase
MTDVLTLRALTQDDLAMVLDWRNHPTVRSYMLTQHEISMPEHRNWFLRVKNDKSHQQLIVLEDAEPIGFVQFNPVRKDGVADWGFYVRPNAPKGSGRKLGFTALRYAFNDLGLHKVCGQAIESNEPSIAFHKMLGFTEEGRLLEQQLIFNKYHTLFLFGLLAKDWQDSKQVQD